MNIGLFFGSFNPIHTGHLIIAEAAWNKTELERIWLVVSPQNPFKQKKNLLSEYNRLRMAEVTLEDHWHIQASGIEFHLPRPSYTIDTLLYLREKYPDHTFSLVMGADNLKTLHKWKNYEAILNHYHIYVYPRGGERPGSQFDEHPNVTFFEAPLLDISSTYIRKTIREGGSIRYLVPDEAREYMESINAYQES